MIESSKLAQSIVGVIGLQDQAQFNTRRTLYDLKDKIIELQKTQKILKQSIIQTDVSLKSPYMNYRQSILQLTYEKEKAYFQSFCQQFKSLSKQQRRPYQTMFRKFKEKITQHSDEIQLAVEKPQQHKKKLQSVRQVWFENQQTEEQQWKFLLRGFIGMFGAFLCIVMIGAANRWGLINSYISSFYKITSDPHLQLKKNSFVGPLTMSCIGLTMKLGLKVCNSYGQTKILILSIIGMSGSIFAASFMDEFAEFIFFNNVLYGIFAGMIFLTALRQCHKYFPKYKLICNSLILMGTGVGAVSFGVLNFSCMNPNSQKALDTGYFSGDRDYIPRHFPVCWRQMSVVLILVGIVATICFYPLVAYNKKEEEIKLQRGEVPDFQNSCYTDEQGLKSGVFWTLVVLIVFGTFGNYYLTANYKNFAKAQKDPIFKNDDYMIMVLLTGQLSGAFCGIFWSLAFKSIGFKYTYIIALIIDIGVYICFISVELHEGNYIIIVAIHFIVQGGWIILISNVCLLIFGDIIGESIYGFCWIFLALTNFFQYFLSMNIPAIADFVKTKINSSWAPQNTYKLYFYPSIVLSILAIIICIFSKLQGRWQNSMQRLTFKCQQGNSM